MSWQPPTPTPAQPTLPPNIRTGSPDGLVGHLATPVQDREIPHYFISETELRMLERGSGNTDRTIAGLAVGAAVAFGIVDRTVSHLSPYNHAFFVVGFWVLLVLAVYSAIRAFNPRSLNRTTANDVRERQTTDTGGDGEAQAALSKRERFGRWIGGE